MNAPSCCQKSSRSRSNVPASPTGWRRAKEGAGVILPGALLALLPKCPMCLAAYIALGTGLSMSSGSAQNLMRLLTLLCIGTVAFFVARPVLNRTSRNQIINSQPTPVHT